MTALFPFEPRPRQLDIVHAARSALAAGGHVVIESGTGSGKTVCALAGALDVARERGKRVLYLTRTNAQERQVVVEYRRVRARGGSPGVAVALQGRLHLCPLRLRDDEVGRASSEELGVMCRDRCRAADAEARGEKAPPAIRPCGFYAQTRDRPGDDVAAWAREVAPTAEELAAECTRRGACPYVASKRLLPEAELVVAPYVYFFEPGLRRAFLGWCGATPTDFVVVVDEAHNLPDFARDLGSGELGLRSIELASREAEEFGDPVVLDGFTLGAFLATLSRVISDLAQEHVAVDREDALVPVEEADGALIHAFRCATPRLDRALATLDEYGAVVRESRRADGRVPRSYVGSVAAFLRFWRRADESTHVRLVRAEGADREPRLECFAVDASVVTEVLLDTAGSIHMSGTLEPLEEYRDSIGLPRDTPLARFPTPFPPENRLTVFDTGVTTRFEDVRRDPRAWDAVAERVRAVREAIPGRNLAVFVPSYDALARVARVLDADATLEPRGARQEDVMAALTRFKSSKGGTLVSVMGGKLSEGLDFPDDELECAVVVGLPYPRPTARLDAMIRFYDRKFGRGWDYAVRAPMTRKVLQSVGRLIRTPTDRGVAIILDRRAALLRHEIPTLGASRDVAADARAFLGIGRDGAT